MELHLLIGTPGSGKSTRAKALLRLGIVDEIISSDEIRFRLIAERNNPYDDPYFVQELEPAVWREVRAAVIAVLESGKTPLLDSTNLLPEHRKQWMQLAREHNAKPVAHVLYVPYEECVRRNAERDRQVPAERVQEMHDDFMIHCDATVLYEEGWKVRAYTLDRRGDLLVK